jgi:hypothetical protein
MVQTEFVFTLPYGYTDEQGVLQRQGVIRRATALDEIEAMGTARVRANEAYLPIALLSRVLVSLGTIRNGCSPPILSTCRGSTPASMAAMMG